MSRSRFVPSPPSRMPSVEDSEYLGISVRSGLPHNLALGSNIEGNGFFQDVGKSFKKIGKTLKPIGKVLKPFASTALDVGVPLATTVRAPELGMFAPAVGNVERGGIKNLTGVGILVGGQKGMRRPMPPMATMGSGLYA